MWQLWWPIIMVFVGSTKMEFDKEYPGTAVQRLNSVHERVKSLTPEQLSGDWQTVRRKLLWAGVTDSLFILQMLLAFSFLLGEIPNILLYWSIGNFFWQRLFVHCHYFYVLLWIGGLKDLNGARPGSGYTGHSFNDFNHCDLTTMLGAYQIEQII